MYWAFHCVVRASLFCAGFFRGAIRYLWPVHQVFFLKTDLSYCFDSSWGIICNGFSINLLGSVVALHKVCHREALTRPCWRHVCMWCLSEAQNISCYFVCFFNFINITCSCSCSCSLTIDVLYVLQLLRESWACDVSTMERCMGQAKPVPFFWWQNL